MEAKSTVVPKEETQSKEEKKANEQSLSRVPSGKVESVAAPSSAQEEQKGGPERKPLLTLNEYQLAFQRAATENSQRLKEVGDKMDELKRIVDQLELEKKSIEDIEKALADLSNGIDQEE